MNWLHNLLGINKLRSDYMVTEHLLKKELQAINARLDVIMPGLGRVIAKLDPKYAESEFSPERKAESDKLAEETIRRLEAEAAARAPYNDRN